MTNYTVSSGQVSTGLTITSTYNYGYPYYGYVDDTLSILSGGKTVGLLDNSGAVATVSSGGAASGSTLTEGRMIVDAGGTADQTVVENGFYDPSTSYFGAAAYTAFDILGTATSTTISGGNAVVEAGGNAAGVVDQSPGIAAYGATVPGGSYGLYVRGAASGVVITGSDGVSGTTTGTTVNGNGTENVLAGGIATSTVVNSGGKSAVSGTAKNTTVAGGSQTVSSGGVAINTTVTGGSQTIGSGGTANGTTINAGTQTVLAGGASTGATVNGGGSVINAGSASGLTLNGGGILTNTGTVVQGSGGLAIATAVTSGGTITNSGTISGAGFGIYSDGGGTASITNSGIIRGTNAAGVAINMDGGGTVTNSGTIVGGSAGQAIKGVSHLVLDPGQSIQGAVQGAAGSTLELAGRGGTLSGLGSAYTGFGTVQLDQGQTWTLTGSGSLGDGATLNLGDASMLVASGPLTDATSGTIAFQGDSVLSLAGSTAGLTVTGFAALDRIDLPGIAYAATDTVTKVGSVVTVSEANGTSQSITIAGAPGENFSLNSVAGGGSVLTVKPVIVSLVAHPDAAGTLGAGNVVTFDLTPNVALNINTMQGVPSLGLSDGGTATFDGTASSAGTLVFRTTVLDGQNTTDLKVGSLSFGNAILVDQFGAPLDLASIPLLAGSDTGIAILTTPPRASDTTAPGAPASLALAPGSDSGVAGDGITNVAQATITGSAEAGSTVRIYDGGPAAVGTGTASGTGLFSIAATLAAGANTLTATATDAAGNVSAASATLAVTLDTTLPTATAITAAPSAPGALGTGATVTFTLTPSAAVSLDLTQGSPTLGLSDGGTATYVATASTGTALVFQDTVLAGQSSSDLLVTGLVLNGATITDTAGNALDVSSVPPLSGSNTGLVVDTTPATPPAMDVTTMPGARGGTVFTTTANASNTVTATASGNDVVNALGTDTIQAGGGSDIVYASGPAATVMGGAGNLTFVAGAGSYAAGGGAGVDILYGGNGPNVLTGGAGKTSIIVAGFGNTSLVGGAGSSGLMFGGFGASTFTGSTGGSDTLVGGAGANTFDMTNGDIAFGGPNGPDTYNTGTGSSLIVEGPGVSMINVGSGLTTDFAGSGLDTYTIKEGTKGVANIIGFKAGDRIALTGGFTSTDTGSNAVSKATTGSFGTTLNLSDGTKVNLFGVSITASQVVVG